MSEPAPEYAARLAEELGAAEAALAEAIKKLKLEESEHMLACQVAESLQQQLSEAQQERDALRAERCLKAPYWQCICGAKAMPLTDDTQCDCQDIYSQEWTRISKEPAELETQVTQQAATIQDLRDWEKHYIAIDSFTGRYFVNDEAKAIEEFRAALASIPQEKPGASRT